MKQRKRILQLLQYILGVNILALGGAFSIVAGQGTTPVNAFPYVLSQIFDTHIRFWMMSVMGVFLIFQGIVLREFRPVYLLQLLAGLLFGSFVDLNLFLIGADLPFGWFGVILYIALSVLCVSFGITLYVDADLLQMPTEGLLSALAKKYPEKLPFHRGKLFSDSLLVIAAVIFSVSILGEIRGVGIATVISALGNGRMVRVFENLFERVRKN